MTLGKSLPQNDDESSPDDTAAALHNLNTESTGFVRKMANAEIARGVAAFRSVMLLSGGRSTIGDPPDPATECTLLNQSFVLKLTTMKNR